MDTRHLCSLEKEAHLYGGIKSHPRAGHEKAYWTWWEATYVDYILWRKQSIVRGSVELCARDFVEPPLRAMVDIFSTI